MPFQHIRLFIRSVSNKKLFFTLTLSGLALGLIAVMLAFVSISDETMYDTFHEDSERIFRVNKYVVEESGSLSKNAETPGLMAPALERDFPEVEMATHIAPWFDDVLLTYEDQSVYADQWVFADSNFFKMFDFHSIRGAEPGKVLATPGQALITPELAEALFGHVDPVGKVIKGLNDIDYAIAGLIESPPRNSHIQYDIIVSWTTTESQSNMLNFSFMNNWLGQTVYTYVLVQDPGQSTAIEGKFSDFTSLYMENRKDTYSFFLQPLHEIYLNSSDLLYLRGGKYGSAGFLRTFAIISLLILLIACFNYINISTAQSLQRAKEVGIKKLLGANKKILIGQFLTETACTSIFAGIIALSFAPVILPYLNQWFVKDIPVYSLYSLRSVAFLAGIVAITSLIAGLFPGMLLSKFKPIAVLRKESRLTPGREWPRKVLIILQLVISIGLIAGTMLFVRQFKYMLNKDLGFDKQQVMVLNTPPGIESNHEAFRNQLKSLRGVNSVSLCQAVVGDGTFGSTVIPDGSSDEMMVQIFRVDTSYLKTFGLEMAEGRFLTFTSDEEAGSIIVNEAFVRQAGWENPLESSIRFPGNEHSLPVTGVLRDFHFNSLHQQITPLIMYLDSRKANISIRFRTDGLSALLPEIEQLWYQFESRFPFNYYFLDDFFAEKYMAEKQMIRIVALFAFVAIFIACLGLYGLSSYTISQKTREIGIRKVLGATIPDIIGLLSWRFIVLVLLSFLIAVPVIYYFSINWLERFAYHTELNIWLFILAGFIVLVIVFLTVSIQSFKASLMNPVESLKTNQ